MTTGIPRHILLGDPQVCPGLVFWVYSRVFFQYDMEPKAPKGGSSRHPNYMPELPQMTTFSSKKQKFISEQLSNVWPPYSVHQDGLSHPMKELKFSL